MRPRRIAVGVLLAAVLLVALGTWLNLRDEAPVDEQAGAAPAAPAQVERGRYLALAGNCAACHTARGGAAYAGGLGIPTPFGTVYASNLTPDAHTGIGSWTSGHFWRALHNGRSKDGRLLYPAFPYPNFTQLTREDAYALFAYLKGLPPVAQANRPHELRFPYDSQLALGVWRALFFEPGVYRADATRDADWNRGAYLVRGLGHCAACHAPRNWLGATSEKQELSGGLIPAQNWYAPSLNAAHEAGVAEWTEAEVVALLKTGVAPRASVLGPMAEVVFRSTQYLSDADLHAMAVFLRSLPQSEARSPAAAAVPGQPAAARLYDTHCADCHGKQGEGKPGAYPALAGNRSVLLASPANSIHVVRNGGFPPATAGNPRPYGMPPFVQTLSDAEIAAVLSHVRTAWGNQGEPVSTLQVQRTHGAR